MHIGIDFGTCFSAAAVMNGFLPQANLLEEGTRSGVPSLFMYSREEKTELYGTQCFEVFEEEKEIVRYMKKTVRKNPGNLSMKVTTGGRDYTLRDVIKKYITYLLERVREGAIISGDIRNTGYESVAIAAPVGIADGQMVATDYNKLLSDIIAEVTGLGRDKIYVIEEPVAAALAYFYSKGLNKPYSGKRKAMVFDLGGGTLDVSVVEHDYGTKTSRVLYKDGDLELGGNDWDDSLAELVMKKCEITAFSNPDELSGFKKVIIDGKHKLSEESSTPIPFKYGDGYRIVEVTRDEFEDATRHLLDRAVELVKKALAACDGEKSVDELVIVGGGSNMPQIKARLVKEFPHLGSNGIVQFDPSKAIAKGAAIRAKFGRLSDVASHTYGFRCRDKRTGKVLLHNLILKGTPYGENGTITGTSAVYYHPQEDDRKSLAFTAYETDILTEEVELTSSMKPNGIRVPVNVPQEYRGRAKQYELSATFVLNENGILKLTVRDKDGKEVGCDEMQVT